MDRLGYQVNKAYSSAYVTAIIVLLKHIQTYRTDRELKNRHRKKIPPPQKISKKFQSKGKFT